MAKPLQQTFDLEEYDIETLEALKNELIERGASESHPAVIQLNNSIAIRRVTTIITGEKGEP